MWEFTSGQKPFANQPYDIHLIMKICDGYRPDITEDTPKCFKELMVQCWDNNSTKRPTIKEIYQTLCDWKNSENMQFEEAESIRKKIIKSYKDKKADMNSIHSEAIYTSRPLNNMIQESISYHCSKQSKFDIMADL
ncbi:8316_t:CDS:2 [Racocetra fulgida]|uniref:8316_t:CDS:1 n=1 Tax=Racocetra fulgida TaxID=60492 RepID=A0A9N8ZUC3_9GLOM|nr:8316_t:CDS:2 [Racocetra fulgida]